MLNCWSQFANESIKGNYQDGSHYRDSHLVATHANLVYLSKEVSDLSHNDVDDYKSFLEYLTNELSRLNLKYEKWCVPENLHVLVELDNILNPSCSRGSVCGGSMSSTMEKYRWTQMCGLCGAAEYNRWSCPTLDEVGEGVPDSSLQIESLRLIENS